MALRARFVGGRGSWSPGGGVVRERTFDDEVVARCCFGRGAEGDDEEGSALVESSGMLFDAHPDRAPTKSPFFYLSQTLTLYPRHVTRCRASRELPYPEKEILYDRRPEMIRTASIKSGHDQRKRTEMTAMSARNRIPRRRLIFYIIYTIHSYPP